MDRDPSLANGVSQYGSYYVGCGAPIKDAVIGGNIEIVKLLLERGADPNRPEEGIAPHGHALYTAVAHRHYDIAKLLLEHGAYANPPVESSADAVSIAIMNGDRRMLELLGSYGAEWEIHMGQIVRLRRFVRERLGKPSQGENDESLALDDARALVARANGYENWEDLEKHVDSGE